MECSFFQIPKGFKISKEYDGLENPPGAGEVDSGHWATCFSPGDLVDADRTGYSYGTVLGPVSTGPLIMI
jgi:hypothetical protein